MNALRIIATGRALPAHQVSNEELSEHMDTSDEWISSRTGIRGRYFCAEGESTTSLAIASAQQALTRAGISPDEVGACIVASFTPDYAVPACACLVQAQLGLPQDAPSFDLNAGCTGFLYALQVMRGLLLQGARKYGIVIGAERISKHLSYDDRSTAVLFGDGAGAVVVKLEEEGIWDCQLGVQGAREILWADERIHMDGQGVFRFAVEKIPHCIQETLQRTHLTLEDLRWIVPHQANKRIIEFAAKKLHAPQELFYQNMAQYGNTSAASIPIALDELACDGKLARGDLFLCVGFGTGLTWGSVLMQW